MGACLLSDIDRNCWTRPTQSPSLPESCCTQLAATHFITSTLLHRWNIGEQRVVGRQQELLSLGSMGWDFLQCPLTRKMAECHHSCTVHEGNAPSTPSPSLRCVPELRALDGQMKPAAFSCPSLSRHGSDET
ncbi:hypothetical protein MPTK1_6g16490 [Marchantia polymorpha subsp. ruderalis]|uniref:Uncharacterized protein n=2 Tax=Marchantia polymorpha TaxID=3197 RepID=A0AAF6BSQ9_MARPO|nr:hypothetical protein MARPO_0170s0028 [Marchantia polymorpha]BBN15043.1 hypothetical protein Mp_6g16490 [Marchantia polymorpha subsp. ruderalis]|eukprot:PTQ28224.1 hypothetical protein MARPO_0170s0028 [Marchantia polymorpha]